MATEETEGQDTGADDQAEATAEVDSSDNAALEQLVGEKMNDIFKANDEQNQRDEDEQTGRVTPENPDGLDVDTEAVAESDENATPAADDTTPTTIAELEAARDEAVAAGDYEKAIELRDRIKEVEAEAAATADAAPKGGKGNKNPVLTDDQRQMLKAVENWTDDDLDVLEQNPAFAKMTYRRVQDKYNQLSLRYAQESARTTPPGLAQPGATNATAANQSATLDSLYKELDKFSEVAGSEMVERFIKPLKNEVLEPLRDVVQFVNEARQRAVADEANTAMSKIAVGDFAETYGNPEKLTPVQENNRKLLYDAADRIMAGARAHRVPMKVTEALNRAHLMLTANIQIANSQRTARKEILSKVKQRATQITSRPSHLSRRPVVKGDQAATRGVEKFWQEHDEM